MQTISWTAKDFGFDMEWPRFGNSRCNASNQPLHPVPEDAGEDAHYYSSMNDFLQLENDLTTSTLS